jgi:small conductance mechanosensitive channel
MWNGVLAGFPPWVGGFLALATAIAVAYLIGEMVARGARAVLTRFADPTAPEIPVRRPVRAIRLTVFVLVFLMLLFPALKVAGMDPRVGFEPETVVGWLLVSGVRIVIIALVAVILIRATTTAVRRFEEEVGRGQTVDALERAKRARTLGALLENAVGVFAIAAALLMVLRELDIDVLPLLTGAGIVGLAIGFGAQTLVKDIISGFFMILENQVRVGDVAVINGTGGVVESVKLRTITLRDVEGTVHVFPNGSITTLANKTKDYSYAVVDVSVAYREDTDRVVQVLRDVGAELRADPQFETSILEPLEVFGVEALGESAVVIKIRFKTLPLRQFDLAREMRRRIKKAFDAQGIQIPFPTVYLAGRLPDNTPEQG